MDFSNGSGSFIASSSAGGLYTFNGGITGDATLIAAMGTPVNAVWSLPGGIAVGTYASAVTLANNSTISPAGLSKVLVTATSNVTGIILNYGGPADGNLVWIVNESAYSITFAASGTSNVSDGTSDVISPLTARCFIWDAVGALWYPDTQGKRAFTAALASTFTATAAGTAAQNVTGLAATLGVGTWKLRGYLPYQGASAAGTTHFGFTFGGTAGTGSVISWRSNLIATPFAAAPVTSATITTVSQTSATLATSAGAFYEVTATIVVTAAGTLQLQAYNGTSGDDTEVLAGAFLEVAQVA
jgi:hypothetical protein